ncbi:MAG: AAA family ATPase, partial [bacterium]
MFYRKYRPQKFSELFGLESVAASLQKLLSSQEIPHAFLFFGPRGVGKTTTARIIAKFINCQKPTKDLEPCGRCSMCVSFANDAFLDLMEIDAASN